MLPVSEKASTGTATCHFVDKTEKWTSKRGTKRENRRCPSQYAPSIWSHYGHRRYRVHPVNFPYGLPSLWEIRAKDGAVLPTIFCCVRPPRRS